MRKARQHFTTIRTEGGILPPDILLRVAELDKSLGGLTPDEYHLPSGDRINEAISRAWSLLVPAWRSFRKDHLTLPTGDTGARLTRDRWLLPLFQQLGYGRLTARGAVRARDREYPISHGWELSPIHLVGCNTDLDTRTAGVAGAAKSSPHSLVQVFLNESEAHRWGFLSNGFRLQVLRDNASLARKSFVEFDLQAMMDGEVYADFRILWLLCHQSRVEPRGGSAIDCWLEKWTKVAQDEGTRALDTLRHGVENAIRILGRGFVSHPANTALKDRLRTGALDQQDYYRQLLRVVYRLLFLFIAEDRGGLLRPDADEAAKSRYLRYYSVDRFRSLVEAGTPGSPHADLWHGLSVVFNALESDGAPSLGLPALGSFLWSHTSTPDLLGPAQAVPHHATAAVVSNAHLLAAVKALAYVVNERRRRPVDYKNLGHEELGSVYESLLELHPRINMDATREEERFVLSSAAGNERKTSGSYYTPDSLVQCLLDSALEPVAVEAVKGKNGKEAEEAILDLKVCDPACGSGHFLIAAARRLALKLARIRTGDEEPPPESIRQALRDVVRRCIYGVDLNPMAVELCKVALWVESLEPGKPLTFLDAHIKCGNSLLGTTPKLMAAGIPDDAFEPLTGDEKKVVSYYKKRNKQEKKDLAEGQGTLLDALRDKFDIKLGNMPAMLASMVREEENDIAAVRRHEQQYAEAVRGTAYENARLLADAWCAAFVWRKHDSDAPGSVPGFPGNWDAITEQVYREIERNPHSIQAWLKDEINRLAAEYRFFHWHLEFPEVFGWQDTPPVKGHLSQKVGTTT